MNKIGLKKSLSVQNIEGFESGGEKISECLIMVEWRVLATF